MCRVPDSCPMRLVKKWLRGGTSTKTGSDARSRCRRQLSADRRSSAAQKPSRPSSSPPPGRLLCPATVFCWCRRRPERDVDDDLQQTIALVSRYQPFRAVQQFNDDEEVQSRGGRSSDYAEADPPSTHRRHRQLLTPSRRNQSAAPAPIFRPRQPPPSQDLLTSIAVSLDGEERTYDAKPVSVLRPDQSGLLRPPPNRVAPSAEQDC